MRPKIYLPVLGLVLLAALLLTLGRNRPHQTPAATEQPPAPASAMETIPAPAAEAVVLTPSPTLTIVLPADNSGLTANDLMSLAMNDDAESLKKILAALASPDPEIRAAAREAAVQFGDRSAAVKLREAAARAADPEEKSALLEAAEFLELPPLEIRSQTNPPAAKPAPTD
jgi:hypothetical protein